MVWAKCSIIEVVEPFEDGFHGYTSYMGVSKHQEPWYRPQIGGLLVQRHAQKGPPIYETATLGFIPINLLG